jgi:hypothetical protein
MWPFLFQRFFRRRADPIDDKYTNPLSVGLTLSLHAMIILSNLLILQNTVQLTFGIISLNVVILHITCLFGFVGPAHGEETRLCGRRIFWWAPPRTGAGAFSRMIIVLVHFLGVGVSVYTHENKACTFTPAVNLTTVPLPTDGGCFLAPDLNVVSGVFDCADDPARCVWREQWSFVDALYFSLVLVSTVGYGHELVPTSPFARSFTMFFAIVGVVVFGFISSDGESLLAAARDCGRRVLSGARQLEQGLGATLDMSVKLSASGQAVLQRARLSSGVQAARGMASRSAASRSAASRSAASRSAARRGMASLGMASRSMPSRRRMASLSRARRPRERLVSHGVLERLS